MPQPWITKICKIACLKFYSHLPRANELTKFHVGCNVGCVGRIYYFRVGDARPVTSTILGAVAIHNIPQRLILNSNLTNPHLPMIYFSVVKSLWNFTWSMLVSLPCAVQNFKMIRQLRKMGKCIFVRFQSKMIFGGISSVYYCVVKWASGNLKSSVNQVFVQQFVETNNKETSKVRVTIPLRGESTNDFMWIWIWGQFHWKCSRYQSEEYVAKFVFNQTTDFQTGYQNFRWTH